MLRIFISALFIYALHRLTRRMFRGVTFGQLKPSMRLDADARALRNTLRREGPGALARIEARRAPGHAGESLVADLSASLKLKAVEAWRPIEAERPYQQLILGWCLIHEAWRARGHGSISEVSESAFAAFIRDLNRAQEALHAASEALPTNATALHGLIVCGRGLGWSEGDKIGLMKELRRRDPDHLGGHLDHLQSVSAKWGGSHGQMFDFAQGALEEAPPGSPLAALIFSASLEWARGTAEPGLSWQGALRRQLQTEEILRRCCQAFDAFMAEGARLPLATRRVVCSYAAAVFYLAEDRPRARIALNVVDAYPTHQPWWVTLGTDPREYLKARKWAGLPKVKLKG